MKTINPQPVIEQLEDMYSFGNGLERSLLRDVIDMLRAAPDVGGGTSFVLIDGVHINLDQIRSFSWKNGELCIWYAGRHFFESWPDPERKRYKDICYALGVLPTEDPEE